MKRVTIIAMLMVITLNLFAQVPSGFKYQAVVRSSDGNPIVNQSVGIQISILQNSEDGNAVYTETHTETTSEFGLINLNIGTGTSSDDFANIDWGNNTFFIKLSIDFEGGTSYEQMGTSQLMSVPYSLHSKTSVTALNDQVDDADSDPNNEIQDLSINGHDISISNGSTITVPDNVDDLDSDPNNELQNISEVLTTGNNAGNKSITNISHVSIGTSSSTTSAALEIESTTQGVLIPRMSTAQRTGISSPANGLLIYDNTLEAFFIYGDNSWVDLSTPAGIWTKNASNIYLTDNSNNVGIGTTTPDGSLVIKANASSTDTDVLFEIKDKDGNSVMQVTSAGVRINVKDGGDDARGAAGGFAVGRIGTARTGGNTLMKVTSDSIRMYVGSGTRSNRGGFAVGRIGTARSGNSTDEFFRVTPDSVRVYIKEGDATRAAAGGFAVGRIGTARALTNDKFLHVMSDSTRVNVDEGTRAARGGFAVGRIGTARGNPTKFMHMTKNNYFIGDNSGSNNTSGLYNLFFGYESGKTNTTGGDNSFFGYKSGYTNTAGTNNVFVGKESGYSNTTGTFNVFVGNESGYSNENANYNTFLGYRSGYSNIGGANSYEGAFNTFMGYESGYSNSTGYKNVSIGYRAGKFTTTGRYNVFIGPEAGRGLTTGQANICIGIYAGVALTSGEGNIMLGLDAGYVNSTGVDNVYLGTASGRTSTGDGCVFLGHHSGYSELGDNKLYIENSTSNSPLIYGEFDNDIVKINGSLTINSGSNSVILPQDRGTSGQFLSTNGSGIASWGNLPASSAANGINLEGTNIELGGTLNETTTINQSAYGMIFNLTSTGDFEVRDNSNTAFIVTDAGKVGVGIASPSYVFHSVDEVVSDDAPAIYGKHAVTDNYGIGVRGDGKYRGVYGYATSASGAPRGVYGYASGSGAASMTVSGVYGSASGGTTGTRYGVYGYATGGTTAYAGYFNGNAEVTGTLAKGGGSFKIDHPLDPENKYLYHSFVESPDMMNIYNGNIILDENGKATVTMEDWFEALNYEFRYQLTALGQAGPNLYISQEVEGNKFQISGGTAGMKVSWQVTGVRKDAFAEKNRIPVEVDKSADEKGLYLHPEAFNKSKNKGINYAHENEKEK